MEFLRSFTEREGLLAKVGQQVEEVSKAASLNFNKKIVIEALSKILHGLVTEERNKHEKKVSSIHMGMYNNSSNPPTNKKTSETIASIRAVRKTPTTNANQATSQVNNSNLPNRKKPCGKKEPTPPVTTPTLAHQTPTHHSSPNPNSKTNSIHRL